MCELIEDVERWRARGERVALATVVRTMASSPRPVGAKMAVAERGAIAGSVSGGCIEGAVVVACQEVLASGQPRLLHFGVGDELAWEVGLACGGAIEVFVEPLGELVVGQRPTARATLIELGAASALCLGASMLCWVDGGAGSLGLPELDDAARTAALALLDDDRCGTLALRDPTAPGTQATLFIESFAPAPTLYMVGGVHIARALVALAKVLGFRTVVIDPRASFASSERFAHADELLCAWPDEALAGRLDRRSYVAILTHDPKIDDPALKAALASPARYIGALGSRATHNKRRARLRADGIADAQLERIHGPIGLPLGGRSAEEIALSILAQIVTVRQV